jgi:Holliday junction resolvase
MNSREKGKRGERQWRDELRANGYEARRGQQFSGSPDSPDVICDALAWLHFEVKCVERLNIEEAMAQAREDAQAKPAPTALRTEKTPIVAHKRNHRRWLVTMDAETFFRFLRGDLPQPNAENLKAETLKSFRTGIETLKSGGGEQRSEVGRQRSEGRISKADNGSRGATSPTNTISDGAHGVRRPFTNNKPEMGRGPSNTNETESQ